jgi:hypothetical protein
MIESIDDLIGFLAAVHKSRLLQPGLSEAEVPVDLPPGLRSLYANLGALVELSQANDERPPFGTQDRLLPCKQLRMVDNMIEFAWENQGNWSARFATGLPDPPVYSNARELWSNKRHGFQPVCESLNHFLTTLCLQEATMSSRNLGCTESLGPIEKTFKTPLVPLWIGGRYVYDEPDHDFWHMPQSDVLVMRHASDIWVGSQTRDVTWCLRPGLEMTKVR